MASTTAESMLSVIPAEIRKLLSEDVETKLICAWTDRQKEIDSKEVEKERLKCSLENEKFQLEKEITEFKQKLEESARTKTELEKSVSELQEKNDALHTALQAQKAVVSHNEEEISKLQEKTATTLSESVTLATKLEVNIGKINDLEERIKSLEEKNSRLSREKYEAVIKAEEVHSLEVSLKFKEERFENEKKLLTHEVEVMQQQLKAHLDDSLGQRRDHSATILSLQSDLDRKIEECQLLQSENEHHESQLKAKSKRIEELLHNLKEMREAEVHLEETYKQELSSQKKMVDIYVGNISDQKEQISELEKGIEQQMHLLQEASEQYGVLERAKKKGEEEAEQAVEKSKEFIHELKTELDRVNSLLEAGGKHDSFALGDLSPAAAFSSKFVRKGWSLSQLYSEYISTSEKRLEAEEENQNLRRYLDQILHDLEEKAPLMTKQREDYEVALDTINTLHTHMDTALAEFDRQRLEFEDSKRKAAYLEKENGRLKSMEKDLSRQVTVLMTQVEAARAGLPPPPLDNGVDENGGPVTCAGDVISQHLVTFRDVEELQQQNKKLLANLREATDKLEAAEQNYIDSKTKELSDELQSAKSELDELRSARDRHKVIIDNISSQRDLYRSLVTQTQGNADSTKTVSSEELKKVKEQLESAKAELSEVAKEREVIREEQKKNQLLLQEEHNQLKETLQKTRSDNMKLLSQAEYNDERIKALAANTELLQRQLSALDSKNHTLHGINSKQETVIVSLKDELMRLQRRVSELESTNSRLAQEKVLLQQRESRLAGECEAVRNASHSQDLILSNLELINNNLERSNSEEKMRLVNRITDLTEQCSQLKAKLQSNTDLKEAQARIEKLESDQKAHLSDVAHLSQQLADAQSELIVAKSKFQEASQKRVSPRLSAGRLDTVRHLQIQLNEEKVQSVGLQSSMQELKKMLKELEEVNSDLRDKLEKSSEINKTVTKQVEVLNEGKDTIAKECVQLKERISFHEKEREELKSSLEQKINELNDQLNDAKKTMMENKDSLAEMRSREELATAKSLEQTRIASEIQEKYEREVVLHGADLKALSALKERLENHNVELQKEISAKNLAEEKLKVIQTQSDEGKKCLHEEKEKLSIRNNELEEQNKSLLDQFTTLSDKMATLQGRLNTSGEGKSLNTSLSEEEVQTTDQYREVIKYLRRERDVLAGKYEVTAAEADRLRAQRQSMEAQLQQLNAELLDEKEKTETSMGSSSQHQEVMRKVQMFDALSDSNRLLREEKESLETACVENKARVEALEKELEPMHDKIRESNSKLESLQIELKCAENQTELYKKRTQELLDKLHLTKQEEFLRIQQELATAQKTNQAKSADVSRLKNQVSQLQKNQQNLIQMKQQLMQQLQQSKEEVKKQTDESRRVGAEKSKFQQQLGQAQEKLKSLESLNQQTQTELARVQEMKTQLQQQLLEARLKDEASQKMVVGLKKEVELKEEKIKTTEDRLADAVQKNENLEKQSSQLRKIANKYKKASEQTPSMPMTSIGEEDSSQSDRVKEMEETITSLKQQLQLGQGTLVIDEVKNLKAQVVTKEEENQQLRSEHEAKMQGLEEEFARKLSEANSQVVDIGKKLDKSQTVCESYESHISQLERDNEALTKEIEAHQKKLSMQQKQLENLQKQSSGVSKSAAGGMSSEKSSSEPPPTANIKPMASPVTVVSVPRSQPVSASASTSRTIPTASIRPMASPMPGPSHISSGAQGSLSGSSHTAGLTSVAAVSPMESHSEGMVSSTVTLPQATVTPTPATPTALMASTTTLTATVSPTPLSQLQPSHATPVISVDVTQSVGATCTLLPPFTPHSVVPPASQTSVVTSSPMVTLPTVSQSSFVIQSHIPSSLQQQTTYQADTHATQDTTSSVSDTHTPQVIAMVSPRVEQSQSAESESMSQPDSITESSGGKRKLHEMEQDEGPKRARTEQEVCADTSVTSEEEDKRKESLSEEMEMTKDIQVDVASQGSERKLAVSLEIEPDQPGSPLQEADEGTESNQQAAVASSSNSMPQFSFSEHSAAQSHQYPSLMHVMPEGGAPQQVLPHIQLPSYEDGAAGDDSIVPSTPTLSVPRREENFALSATSHQVPSSGFAFSASSERATALAQSSGLEQMFEEGLVEGIPLDVAQLEEANSVSTPQQKSPEESNAETGVSTSDASVTKPDTCRELGASAASTSLPSSEDSSSQGAEALSYPEQQAGSPLGAEADSQALEMPEDPEIVEVSGQSLEEASDSEPEEEGEEEEEEEEDDGIIEEFVEDSAKVSEASASEEDQRSGQGTSGVSESTSSTSRPGDERQRRITPVTWSEELSYQRHMNLPRGQFCHRRPVRSGSRRIIDVRPSTTTPFFPNSRGVIHPSRMPGRARRTRPMQRPREGLF